MSTNPNTKTYWRRVSRMARELECRFSLGFGDQSVTEIMVSVDPKATRTMHREAIKMAIEGCGQSERSYTKLADECRKAQTTLREFAEPIPLRVIDGGTAEAIRQRWPAVEG